METVNLDWKNLPFGYVKTDANVRSYYKDGKWGPLEMHEEETITVHMASTCLHYSQECFEGLKAYRGKDGKIRLFRPEENAKRMQRSADYLRMQAPPVKLFVEAVKKAVEANVRFIPPYGSGASLYIRPVLLGIGATVGVKSAPEYAFVVFVTPVGPYFKEGFNCNKAIVEREYDRAAPKGTGHVKAGGNYGASMYSNERAHVKGFPSIIYLDAKEKRYIDEFAAANFFGIKGNSYVTPDSHTVLPSITNMSLRTLAEDLGMKVENRPVDVAELGEFSEVGACGTAAVISPIGEVFDPGIDKTHIYGDGKHAGPVSTKLYETLLGIQYGEVADKHNWCVIL